MKPSYVSSSLPIPSAPRLERRATDTINTLAAIFLSHSFAFTFCHMSFFSITQTVTSSRKHTKKITSAMHLKRWHETVGTNGFPYDFFCPTKIWVKMLCALSPPFSLGNAPVFGFWAAQYPFFSKQHLCCPEDPDSFTILDVADKTADVRTANTHEIPRKFEKNNYLLLVRFSGRSYYN